MLRFLPSHTDRQRALQRSLRRQKQSGVYRTQQKLVTGNPRFVSTILPRLRTFCQCRQNFVSRRCFMFINYMACCYSVILSNSCLWQINYWNAFHGNFFVNFRPLESDPFTSQVTLDVGSTFGDEHEVRNTLEQQLQYHSLGGTQVSPDGFTFRNFQGNRVVLHLTGWNDRSPSRNDRFAKLLDRAQRAW